MTVATKRKKWWYGNDNVYFLFFLLSFSLSLARNLGHPTFRIQQTESLRKSFDNYKSKNIHQENCNRITHCPDVFFLHYSDKPKGILVFTFIFEI